MSTESEASRAEPFESGTDEHAIWAAVLAIYAGFVANDRAAIDANISPDATMFDSDVAPLIHGRVELDAIRDARPPRDPADPVARLEASAPEVRVFGDTAVLLHLITVDLGDGSPAQAVRNTSVWRRASGAAASAPPASAAPASLQPARWLMVHNHEDVLAAG